MALDNSDEYAWQLFLFLNRQAKRGSAGVPDRWKRFGHLDPDAPVVWESWALASGGPDISEVFKRGGIPPGSWKDLDRKTHPPLKLDRNRELEMLEAADVPAASPGSDIGTTREQVENLAGLIPPKPDDNNQEVRMNQAAFESVVKQDLFSCDGLEKLLGAARNQSAINVTPRSKEIKAAWRKIRAEDEKRYYWRKDAKEQIWGLVALHISTKDLPTWFWADFDHVDCEEASGPPPCDRLPVPAVDTTTHGSNGADGPHGSNGVREETLGTVWENYRLRGTQVAFTSSIGDRTKLYNPFIEKNHPRSSCITCHALATVGQDFCHSGSHLPTKEDNEIGPPRPEMFGYGTIDYLQTDFMWSPVMLTEKKSP